MEKKTKETYKKGILEKYKLEKTRELSSYLFNPTPGLIKEACEVVFEKRKADNDIRILRNFFKPKENENILSAIHRIETTKFKPVVSFLKEDTKDPNSSTLELISWLVDYSPRPFFEYLQKGSADELGYLSSDAFKDINQKNEDLISTGTSGVKIEKEDVEKKGTKRRKKIIRFIVLGSIILVMFFTKDFINKEPVNLFENRCMAWAKNQYEKVPCNLALHKKYGTTIEPYDSKKIANFKKVEVTMKTDFFVEETNKPLIWYTKNKDGEIEYFTSPGLHPITGKTLDEITPYIIQKYVPLHSGGINSFAD
ncbi:hypothetical protein Q4Q39_06745 [Flavivirga amylovorans]|uniref:Uncharacterized protein n=1 Tax=Flavivirga amylovorans TaxID=870486 RepID=A0ABT8WZJ7_9FLAO|nr:hypothetical protein [Flavivirga amylovorans]MDO5987105.1 hypothetical protein [Flavivirga amylovorans]